MLSLAEGVSAVYIKSRVESCCRDIHCTVVKATFILE